MQANHLQEFGDAANDYLDYLAKVQCDLTIIRNLYIDDWDGDRIIKFAKQLAIRSRQIEDGLPKDEATKELDAALLNICTKKTQLEQTKIEWALLNACLKRMDVGALRRLSIKIDEWLATLSREKVS